MPSVNHLQKIMQTRITITITTSTTNVESLLCDRHHIKPFTCITLFFRIQRRIDASNLMSCVGKLRHKEAN